MKTIFAKYRHKIVKADINNQIGQNGQNCKVGWYYFLFAFMILMAINKKAKNKSIAVYYD